MYLKILAFGLLSLPCRGEYVTSTVIANPGIYMKSKPDNNSENVEYLKLGRWVDVLGPYPLTPIIMDSMKGYWLEVQGWSQDTSHGYIFSSYLFPGELNINSDLFSPYGMTYPRILSQEDDFYFDELRGYSLTLDTLKNWYGALIQEDSTYFYPLQIHSSINYYKNSELYFLRYAPSEQYKYLDSIFYFKIDSDTIFDFYIGHKNPIPGKIKSIIHKEPSFYQNGVFVYPGQNYPIGGIKNEFKLLGKAVLQKSGPDSSSIEIGYDISFQYDYDKFGRFQANAFNESDGSFERHARYRTPSLVWTGDINDDGYPELAFFVTQMTESEGESGTSLFMSSYNDSVLTYDCIGGINIYRIMGNQ